MTTEFDELKKIVTGILVSSPLRLTLGHIDRDYAELVGERIPFRKFGFTTLEGCLQSMRDVLEVIGTGPRAEVILHVSDKSSHINKLVTKQRVNKPKGKPSRFGSRPARGRRKTMGQQYHPTPLMSLAFPQMYNNFFGSTFHNTMQAVPHPSNVRMTNKHCYFGNYQSRSPSNYSSFPQKNTYPVKKEPISASSNGTIPKQTNSHQFKGVTNSNHSEPQRQKETNRFFESNKTIPSVENLAAGTTVNCPSNSAKTNINPITVNEPILESCNVTVTNRTNIHKFKSCVDSDSSDAENIYLSDTDEENDNSYLNMNQEIQYVPQEQIYKSHEEVEKFSTTLSEPIYSNNIPVSIQDNLRKIISNYEDGVWCGSLPEMYKKMFRKELDYAEYGYRSLISMCLDLHDIFYCIRPDTGDFKLYDKRKELPKDYNKSIKISQMLRYFKDDSDKPSTEPAVIDVENEYSSFYYPENVLELYEEIPRIFLSSDKNEDDYIDVCVGEIYDPSKFWVLLDEFTEQLNNLMDEIQTFYTSIDTDYKIPEHMITVGLYCIAQYNKEYHRAVIVNTIQSVKNKVKVYYLDYGTVSAVDIGTLKFLHRKFSDLPQQAIRARLASIYPPTEKTQWPSEASSRLLQLVTNKTLVAHIHRIDRERQIVELFLVDTTGADDVYMNDALVEEGYAIFTNQEQSKVVLEAYATPWVKHIHLFPTFLEIEHSAVPSASEMIRLQKVGIPLEQIYPRYFVQENTHDELLCNDLKDTDSLHQDMPKQKEKDVEEPESDDLIDFLDVSKKEPSIVNEAIIEDCLIPKSAYPKPPPGYEGVKPSNIQFNSFPQQTAHPNLLTNNYVAVNQLMQHYSYLQQQQQQQQMPYQNLQAPYYSSGYNQYYPNQQTIFQHQRQLLQERIYQFLISNQYLTQVTLTQYLVQQGQWQFTSEPYQIYTYLSTILNSATPITDEQKKYLFQEVVNVLTNQQIEDLIQTLTLATAGSFQGCSQQVNETTKFFHNLNLYQSQPFTHRTYSSDVENVENVYNEQKDCFQKNPRLIAETELNGLKIHVIWYSKEVHVNIEEIMQLISNKIPIENIRKQIVMMDPTISIIDVPLSSHEHLYEEMLRYKKNIDKHTVLHIVPVSSIQNVLTYLGSTLDISSFLSKVNASTDLWFKIKT